MKYPNIEKAVQILNADNGCSDMTINSAITLSYLFPTTERFLSTLDEDDFETFLCGEEDEANKIRERSPFSGDTDRVLNAVFEGGVYENS